jgi:hypothetical protein
LPVLRLPRCALRAWGLPADDERELEWKQLFLSQKRACVAYQLALFYLIVRYEYIKSFYQLHYVTVANCVSDHSVFSGVYWE